MTTVRRALFLSFVERYLMLAVALASNMLLARLLTPEQVGVFSVSLAVIGIAQALRDFGVGNYLIQEVDLTPSKTASAFTLSLAIGSSLFLLALAAAPSVAAFYGEPRMIVTVWVAALNFLLMPIGTVCMSLLRRTMSFRDALVANLLGTIVGAVVSVGLALAAFGETSLAWGSVATQGVTALVAWWMVRHSRPIGLGWSNWRAVARFGGMSSTSGLVTSISMDANDLVVGKLLGFQSVAILSRAQGLSNLVHRDLLGAVRNVALPALAQARRDGSDVGAQFLKGVANMVLLAWVLYGFLACFALEAVRILYGSQWMSAVPLVPIFCLGGAFAAINVITPNLLVAIGQMKVMMVLDLVFQPFRLLMIAGAAFWFRSIEACAWAFCISAIISVPVFWLAKCRYVVDDLRDLRKLLAATACTTAATLVPAFALCAIAGFQRTEPLGLVYVLTAVAAGLLIGLWTLGKVGHPLCHEPSIQRVRVLLRLSADRT